MSRLIDADKLHSEFMKMAEFKPNSEIGEPTCGCTRRLVFHISEGIRKINEQPTVDAEPIRHGHWNILTPQDDVMEWWIRGKDYPSKIQTRLELDDE